MKKIKIIFLTMLVASPSIHAMSMKDSLAVGALSLVTGVAGVVQLVHQINAHDYSLKNNVVTSLLLGTSLTTGLYLAWRNLSCNAVKPNKPVVKQKKFIIDDLCNETRDTASIKHGCSRSHAGYKILAYAKDSSYFNLSMKDESTFLYVKYATHQVNYDITDLKKGTYFWLNEKKIF